MSGTRSASGLMCSHGSELDTKIPRPKMPKSALPPDVRKKMGFDKVRKVDQVDDTIWKPGSGVLAPTGSAPDGKFLKRGSGVPMSKRASALAQQKCAGVGARAVITRARVVDENSGVLKEVNADRRRRQQLDDMKGVKKMCVAR